MPNSMTRVFGGKFGRLAAFSGLQDARSTKKRQKIMHRIRLSVLRNADRRPKTSV